MYCYFILGWITLHVLKVTEAFPNGAGACLRGQPSQGGSHLDYEEIVDGTQPPEGVRPGAFGPLSGVGTTFRINGNHVLYDQSVDLSAGVEYSWELESAMQGFPFRGVLLRLDAPEGSGASITGDSSDLKLAEACQLPAIGVTHADNSDKSKISGTFRMDSPAEEVLLDVNTVYYNTVDNRPIPMSLFGHSKYVLNFGSSERVPATSDPITESPLASPTKSPTMEPTSEPTFPETSEPTGTPTANPTKTPTQSPTESPTFMTTQPTREPVPNPTSNPTASPTMISATNMPTSVPTQEKTDVPVTVIQAVATENPTEATPVQSNATDTPVDQPILTAAPVDTLNTSPPTSPPPSIPLTNETVATLIAIMLGQSNTTVGSTARPTVSNMTTTEPTNAQTGVPTRSPVTASSTESPMMSPTALPTLTPSRAPVFPPTTPIDIVVSSVTVTFRGARHLHGDETLANFEMVMNKAFYDYYNNNPNAVLDGPREIERVLSRVMFLKQETTSAGVAVTYNQRLSYAAVDGARSAEEYALEPFSDPKFASSLISRLRSNVGGFERVVPPIDAAITSEDNRDSKLDKGLIYGLAAGAAVLIMAIVLILCAKRRLNRVSVKAPPETAPSKKHPLSAKAGPSLYPKIVYADDELSVNSGEVSFEDLKF